MAHIDAGAQFAGHRLEEVIGQGGMGVVYAVGGRALAPDKNSATLERYDPASDKWTKLPSMPTASGGLSAAVVGGRLITVGGESPTDVINAVQAYDIAKQTWSSQSKLHTARHGIAVAALNDELYAIYGATAAGHVDSSDKVEVLDLE
jgi:N-acetylneuraminic acid mutarotase